ncbi:MAG TPA: alpha/beta hydrolase [Anaerolineales bacterium]|nr:alpha/beta hydrolase [Anaerolineales bacterium]
MSAIILDGSIVHYEALGKGRPIVFLHGWVGSWRYWISAMQVASTSYRAYAFDLYGFGDTAHEPLKYSLERQADLLDRFLGVMGIGKIAIIGHGLGALVGLEFIKQFKNSVDRIMLVGCPLSYDAVNARLRTAPIAELVEWLSTRTPDTVSALSDASKTDPIAVAASLTGLQANGLVESVHDANIPCLFVFGENDPAITLPPEGSISSFMMHQVVLENIGHFPMIEDPLKFNRLMTDFLALDSGVSPTELQLKEEWKRRMR